ncbi:hypothetical protein CHCC20441_3918 [Bacillus licheniformis]|uniref:DUF1642 domain-containing protein n=1 Tax=Bacillus licheniformis TaxID=1402 RepID=A0A8B5Y9S3_BACLI|nr:hypothetical protein [Bacillus licheniformis]ARC58845.1 hypothetical protein BaDB11_00176 [Bacillus licheniformis]MCU9959188.1 hypothetical protein [Bacillus licheniformis]MDE1425556.1 hypothetical protein [Bacillus licheniformis]MDK7625961.1 hypothetical protein [Bacillus licheniformis]MEC2046391.1 hypothetical protein [Bacillus licheniformis]
MSEIKKPVITKEQADSIAAFLEVGTKEELLTAKVHCCHFGDEYSGINTIDIMTLASALINGYEVEKTPEEKVREYYESHGGSPSAEERKAAIRETLYKLGIKIEGVNA